ncbi:MAG TPA: thioredoxin-disulfide reductase [Fibrobacteria bacterium]|nr:thioredoxin-disulfide reductase [Fibrobacteria bacterium]
MERVIIVGSGPAGLTAALYASRANLQPLCIEGWQPLGLLMTTTEVENFPGFPEGVMGPELMMKMREQAEKFGTRFITENASKLELLGDIKKVWVEDKVYETRTVILATGASSIKLGIPSEETYLYGKGISTCATCDGAFYKKAVVAVLGGGDSAMEEANFLTNFADKVYLIHRRDEFRASRIMVERAKANPKIEIVTPQVVDEFVGDGKALRSIRMKHAQTGEEKLVDVAGAFVAIGHKPNTELFAGQLDLDAKGYVQCEGRSQRTSIPGVMAAGDLQDTTYKQAITSAGSGCVAALDAQHYLEHHGW